MHIRPLQISDYTVFLDIMNDFRETTFTLEQMQEVIYNQKNLEIFLLEHDKQVIGAGSILFETKFIHNISIYAHIEDIVIKKEYRGNNYGKILVDNLITICQDKKCYKILLDCESALVPFYSKCGLKNNGHQMVKYL